MFAVGVSYRCSTNWAVRRSRRAPSCSARTSRRCWAPLMGSRRRRRQHRRSSAALEQVVETEEE